MKKISLLSTVLLVVPVVALAQGFVPLAPITGLTDASSLSVANSTNLASFFNNLYKFSIGIAAALAVIQIIWAGLDIAIFHKDAVSAITDDKGKIYNAVFGLILVLSPVLVFSIINPSILNLSLNLPPLKTASGTLVGTGSTGGAGTGTGTQPTTDAGTTAATTAGCTITGTLLKTAICPTQQAAQDFATACKTGPGNVPFFTTDHKATCGTEPDTTDVSKRYAFIDTSQSTGFVGWFNTITGYSYYEPVASTPINANNGTDVVQFASTCSTDGGTICMSATKVPIPLSMCTTGSARPINSQSNTFCWGITLSCTDGKTGAGGCSSSPGFKIVN